MDTRRGGSTSLLTIVQIPYNCYRPETFHCSWPFRVYISLPSDILLISEHLQSYRMIVPCLNHILPPPPITTTIVTATITTTTLKRRRRKYVPQHQQQQHYHKHQQHKQTNIINATHETIKEYGISFIVTLSATLSLNRD